MSVYILAGEYANILKGAESITVTSTDSLFPKANLYDELPGKPFKFDTPSCDATIDVDANRALNGAFDDWSAGTATVPDSWNECTVDVPQSVDREATSGETKVGNACELTGNTAAGAIYEDITVLSGWAMTAQGSISANTSNAVGVIRVRNLVTGKWLTSAGAWQATTTSIAKDANDNGTYVDSGAITFTVENYATTKQHACTLRVFCRVAGPATSDIAFFDSIAVWPHVDFASIHGFKNLGGVIPKLQSDDNSAYSSVTAQATGFTGPQPAFFTKLSALKTERYWRVLFDGSRLAAEIDPIEVGELVLGQQTTLTNTMRSSPGVHTDFTQPQIRSGGVQPYGTSLTEQPSRVKEFEYLALSCSQRDQVVDELYVRSKLGQHPVVLVPFDSDAEVIHGRLAGNLPVVRHNAATDYYSMKIVVTEDPFNISVA